MRFLKAPKTFRSRKAIYKNMINSFYKALILTCLHGKKCITNRGSLMLRKFFIYRIQSNLSCSKSTRKSRALGKRTPAGPRYSGFLRNLHAYQYNGNVARFMTMWKKQILARAIRILKEIGGNRAFQRYLERKCHTFFVFKSFF